MKAKQGASLLRKNLDVSWHDMVVLVALGISSFGDWCGGSIPSASCGWMLSAKVWWTKVAGKLQSSQLLNWVGRLPSSEFFRPKVLCNCWPTTSCDAVFWRSRLSAWKSLRWQVLVLLDAIDGYGNFGVLTWFVGAAILAPAWAIGVVSKFA